MMTLWVALGVLAVETGVEVRARLWESLGVLVMETGR